MTRHVRHHRCLDPRETCTACDSRAESRAADQDEPLGDMESAHEDARAERAMDRWAEG